MDASGQVVIARPRPAVAAIMFDLRYASLWATGVVSCTPLAPGPMRAGLRVKQVARFLGVKSTFIYEVVSMEQDRFVELRIDSPLEMWVLHELEDAPAGTLVRIRTASVGGDPGFTRLFGRVLGYLARYNVRRDLRQLKQLVESRPA